MRWIPIYALLALAPSSALADSDEVVVLEYAAPSECPTRDELIAQIQTRTAVRFEAGAPRVFEVTVTTSPTGYAGTLAVSEHGAPDPAGKQLEAARCDDLVSALALVTALAIDPTAAHAPEPRQPPEPAVTPPARPVAKRRWTPGATIGLGVDAGITPDPLLVGRLAVGARWQRFAIDLAVLGGRDTTTEDGAVATFTWVAARPAACWSVLQRRIDIAGCAHLESGLVRAGGMQIVNGRDVDRWWIAAGVHGDVRWPLGSRGFAQLQVGLSVPFVRDRYRFMPDVLVHETAALTAWSVVGVGLRFL